MMDGLKIIVPMLSLLVLLTAVATPAMAQSSSDTMGDQASQDTQMGQAQQGQPHRIRRWADTTRTDTTGTDSTQGIRR